MRENLIVAGTFTRRLLGLIPFTRENAPILIIPDCKAIHTCFIRFPIAVICLDDHGNVVAENEYMKPFRFFVCRKARCIIEVPL